MRRSSSASPAFGGTRGGQTMSVLGHAGLDRRRAARRIGSEVSLRGRVSVCYLTWAEIFGESSVRRRPVAEPWNIRPSWGSIGEGDVPSRSSSSQAISQHRVAGGRGCPEEACP
jgi:hypothetical protein